MQKQIRKDYDEAPLNEKEALRNILDSAIDRNQMILIKADILSQYLHDTKQSKKAMEIKEDAIRSAVSLQKMAKMLDDL
jgi:hypothetical protein